MKEHGQLWRHNKVHQASNDNTISLIIGVVSLITRVLYDGWRSRASTNDGVLVQENRGQWYVDDWKVVLSGALWIEWLGAKCMKGHRAKYSGI